MMKRAVGLWVLLTLLVGCESRPVSEMPVGTHGPRGAFAPPVPEHQRLLKLTERTPSQQAQLMLFEAFQARGNVLAGTDRAKIEFSSGRFYPVRAEWRFDTNCHSLTVVVKWDERIKTNHDIHLAVSRVLNNGFWRNLDTFYFLHGALHWHTARAQLKPVNSSAVFYCSAKRTNDNELVIRVSTRTSRQSTVDQEQ